MKVTRVSKAFKVLRQSERKARQIKADSYLESIQSTSNLSLRKEITRKSDLVL